MRPVLDQAELFMAAAACMALGLLLLFLALGFWADTIDRLLRFFCLHAAFADFVWSNRDKKWWGKPTNWWYKLTHPRATLRRERD